MLGVGLSLALVLLAALLGLREHQARRDQADERAALVAHLVERQLRDRLAQLEAVLAAQAAALDDEQGQATLRALHPRLGIHSATWLPGPSPGDGVAPDSDSTAGLVLPAPAPGDVFLDVAWQDGAGGRVQASLDPQWLLELLQGHDLGEGAVVALLHDTQRMYLRSHDNARLMGQPLRDLQLFAPEWRGQDHGTYEARSQFDGRFRQIAYRKLAGTPLTLIVGQPRAAVAAPAWGFLAMAMLVACVLGVLWLWLLRTFGQLAARQSRLLRELGKTSARLQQAHSMASLGTWRWHPATRQSDWSEGLYRIHGRDPSLPPPDSHEASSFLHPDDRDRVIALGQKLGQGEGMAETEYRIVREDGEVRWLHAYMESDHDADGLYLMGVGQDVTELARAREQLRQAEQEYRFLFESNPVPMAVYDRQTLGFLAVNEAMRHQYGYSREELLGMSVLDIRPAEDRERVAAEATSLGEVRPQGAIWTHLRRDGARIRAAIHTHDIEFEGRPARMVAAQDVTEREADALRFRLLARATADAVWDWDVVRGSLWWGDTFYTTFGYARGQMAPTVEAWQALVHPDERVRVASSLAAAAADHGVEEWQERYRFLHVDGRYREVIDRGFVLRDEHGNAYRMLGGMRDVTEQRRSDERMRLLSRAIEATANGVVISDALQPDWPLVYVNRAFEQITGYSAEECIGRNPRFLQGNDHDQVGLQGIRYAIQEKREAWVLLRNYRKDGSLFWNEFYIAPVFDDHGVATHFVGVQNDVSEHHNHQQEMARRASHDQLTGLPNRQLLQDTLQVAVLAAERGERDVAVLFIDLDDFKLVNDSLDHSAGDEALRLVAARLQQQAGTGDLAGRFGGDEFVIVMTEHATEARIGELIARIRTAMSEPIVVAGIEHVLTMSVGWCRYSEGGHDAETLLKYADIAMYEAKRQGRNRSVGYSYDLNTRVSRRLQLIAQLRDALDQQQFVLAFQPIYDRKGAVCAVECLARWQHPQRGLLLPSEFIEVCEQSGLIMELGRRTLHEAARHHALLDAAGFGHVRLSVNVSAVQFGHALEEDVAAVMSLYQLPHGVLELELTESVIMENADRAIDTMHRIAELGVCLSVDDFGTGYSSLAYLKRLPIDRLKIDRSFVLDLPDDRDAASICSSIIALAHSLGLQTVGEGVENQSQLRWLSLHGCDEMQGFLMSRPVPWERLLDTLREVRPGHDG